MSKSWKLVTTELGRAIQCPYCDHKISLLHVLFADSKTSDCPFCNREVSWDKLDYDEILSQAEGARDEL